jgi:hypothetical protein
MRLRACWGSKLIGNAVPSYTIINFDVSKKRRDRY